MRGSLKVLKNFLIDKGDIVDKDYKDFVEYCYSTGKQLAEAMKEEISSQVGKAITGENTEEQSADNIMQLIFETKYEW